MANMRRELDVLSVRTPRSRSTPGHGVFLETQDGDPPMQGGPQPPSGPPSSSDGADFGHRTW
eukprot:160321-Prymnesium_polylepis.1